MNFSIGWFIERMMGDTFDALLLGRLSALGVDLQFHVYNGGRYTKSGDDVVAGGANGGQPST